MLPEDLAILFKTFKNVRTVKEATGNPENMKKTRKCCGPNFSILSGDDGLTMQMMSDPAIKASGVISVISNIAPKAVAEMVNHLNNGEVQKAEEINAALDPLYNLITVKTRETTEYGEVEVRARNPLAIKTVMSILGLPSGACRKPLGRMTRKGFNYVLETIRNVQEKTPEILRPAAEFFNLDFEARLNSAGDMDGLIYSSY
jgi:4-hydroxy-tetrahydrodipicolinate synthase